MENQNDPNEIEFLSQHSPTMMAIVGRQLQGVKHLMSQGDRIPPNEVVTLAISEAHLTITLATLGNLYDAAMDEQRRRTGLVVAQTPGLVGPDGEPVSRQARRYIERKAKDAKEGQEPDVPAVQPTDPGVDVPDLPGDDPGLVPGR